MRAGGVDWRMNLYGGVAHSFTNPAADGSRREFKVRVRIDTPKELEYYRHGGILPFVLRQLISES